MRIQPIRAAWWPLLVALLATPGCSDATYEPPQGCIVDSETAIELADEYVREQALGWGEATRLYFGGGLWRAVYETPPGEPERALIVNCATAQVALA